MNLPDNGTLDIFNNTCVAIVNSLKTQPQPLLINRVIVILCYCRRFDGYRSEINMH